MYASPRHGMNFGFKNQSEVLTVKPRDMNNPKIAQTIPDPTSPDKQQPGRENPNPVQPPPDKPEVPDIPEEVPDIETPRKPADPKSGEQAFERKSPEQQ
ncbi:hypothetical protein SAMN05660909_00451 [Chitinophaga terrae (ex Kim and Jung 2007)]|uniref:Uncharacterized protein n=2 Tax=Chitinophaga terrae (ex Kim and Jung 2007) TaxID=408074 RepID=A0A1H3XTX6_9BACT|nr:hypothetical protein SAMN05660909_00451 [Chitinophaga terrae (ex Kim and Jung 2007)]